jgi:2-keto-4-pentenoate hydratase/2-oxohepta-3-ene-1,7-dioic acid hydratase in catechol pathway
MQNQTNDPKLKSWVPVAPDSDFPIQNLPFGVFRRRDESPRVGVAIGEMVLDLAALHAAGHFDGTPLAAKNVFARDCLNDFLALGRAAWSGARNRISLLLSENNPTLRDDPKLREKALAPQSEVEMLLPIRVGDYSDFYASIHHASNVGSMFRDPANPLLPNWKHLPVGYHGRSSSIIVSGVDVVRPHGQLKPKESAPVFAPTRELDFELEMGFITGQGNKLGSPIPIREAPQHIFGMVLLNDWSARDIQRFSQNHSPQASRRGLSRSTRWIRSVLREKNKTRPCCRIYNRAAIGISTSSSKCCCKRRRWTNRSASAPATRVTSTGALCKCSRTRPATVATLARVTFTARGQFQVRRKIRAVVCWNSAGTKPNRCNCRAARRACISKTATP